MNRILTPFYLFLIASLFLSTHSYSQKTLSSTDQALRYSLYSRLGLKIIPVKISKESFKVQLVIEKIEENPTFANFSFSYSILNSYDQEILSDQINLLTENDLIANSERHWIFEKTV
jgi:hypothetical protein